MTRTIILFLLLTLSAFGACTGSGLSWQCPSGSTGSDVDTALASASDGATVTFAAGTYPGGYSFRTDKGATLICASQGACAINLASGVAFVLGNVSGTKTHAYRISGFAISGSPTYVMWFYGIYNDATIDELASLRIDHNTFTNNDGVLPTIAIQDLQVQGVIDHNVVNNAGTIRFVDIGGGDPSPGHRGTSRNLFIEDNTITITTMTNASAGVIDAVGGANWVWRYNTVTNGLLIAHGVTHDWGPVNIEIYNNQMVMTSGAESFFQGCNRCLFHQGSGELLAFNNSFTPYSGHGAALTLTHYRSAPPEVAVYSIAGRCDGTDGNDGNREGMQGYPCKRQPGRDSADALQPMYIWNNAWTDDASMVPLYIANPWSVSNPSVEDHIVADRDYYNAVSKDAQTTSSSPFNGTTGMGFGTLARRPSTCTTGAESGGGVGYFATNDGPQGTLYRCSATNTWTVQYTPYTYPHPLQGVTVTVGSGSGGPKRGGGPKTKK
jgi:hypothetical protein